MAYALALDGVPNPVENPTKKKKKNGSKKKKKNPEVGTKDIEFQIKKLPNPEIPLTGGMQVGEVAVKIGALAGLEVVNRTVWGAYWQRGLIGGVTKFLTGMGTALGMERFAVTKPYAGAVRDAAKYHLAVEGAMMVAGFFPQLPWTPFIKSPAPKVEAPPTAPPEGAAPGATSGVDSRFNYAHPLGEYKYRSAMAGVGEMKHKGALGEQKYVAPGGPHPTPALSGPVDLTRPSHLSGLGNYEVPDAGPSHLRPRRF